VVEMLQISRLAAASVDGSRLSAAEVQTRNLLQPNEDEILRSILSGVLNTRYSVTWEVLRSTHNLVKSFVQKLQKLQLVNRPEILLSSGIDKPELTSVLEFFKVESTAGNYFLIRVYRETINDNEWSMETYDTNRKHHNKRDTQFTSKVHLVATNLLGEMMVLKEHHENLHVKQQLQNTADEQSAVHALTLLVHLLDPEWRKEEDMPAKMHELYSKMYANVQNVTNRVLLFATEWKEPNSNTWMTFDMPWRWSYPAGIPPRPLFSVWITDTVFGNDRQQDVSELLDHLLRNDLYSICADLFEYNVPVDDHYETKTKIDVLCPKNGSTVQEALKHSKTEFSIKIPKNVLVDVGRIHKAAYEDSQAAPSDTIFIPVKEGADVEMTLVSYAAHTGDVHGGHYIAYAKVQVGADYQWVKYNDTSVQELGRTPQLPKGKLFLYAANDKPFLKHHSREHHLNDMQTFQAKGFRCFANALTQVLRHSPDFAADITSDGCVPTNSELGAHFFQSASAAWLHKTLSLWTPHR
jgi:hypothetical protein